MSSPTFDEKYFLIIVSDFSNKEIFTRKKRALRIIKDFKEYYNTLLNESDKKYTLNLIERYKNEIDIIDGESRERGILK
jgi:hypothetical protein